MANLPLENRLVKFLKALTGQDGIQSNTDLIEAGIADSLTMMDLLVFIETEVGIRLDFTDLTPEIFRTPATIAGHLTERLAAPRASRPEAA